MTFEHVLAVVPVSDHGWVQVMVDGERAGSGMLNLAVDDLERQLAELVTRGVVPGEVIEVNKGVRLSTFKDPDGNTITLIGGFRVHY